MEDQRLDSILITAAQIGRQKRSEFFGTEEYRHALLILKADRHRRRHVLCAGSDAERDSWVDMLVRYVSGTYAEAGPSESHRQNPTLVNAKGERLMPTPAAPREKDVEDTFQDNSDTETMVERSPTPILVRHRPGKASEASTAGLLGD